MPEWEVIRWEVVGPLYFLAGWLILLTTILGYALGRVKSMSLQIAELERQLNLANGKVGVIENGLAGLATALVEEKAQVDAAIAALGPEAADNAAVSELALKAGAMNERLTGIVANIGAATAGVSDIIKPAVNREVFPDIPNVEPRFSRALAPPPGSLPVDRNNVPVVEAPPVVEGGADGQSFPVGDRVPDLATNSGSVTDDQQAAEARRQAGVDAIGNPQKFEVVGDGKIMPDGSFVPDTPVPVGNGISKAELDASSDAPLATDFVPGNASAPPHTPATADEVRADFGEVKSSTGAANPLGPQDVEEMGRLDSLNHGKVEVDIEGPKG